jgi:hypothetical protein
MMGTSRPLEPAAFLTHAWNSPSADGVHAHGTRESARDHGSGVKGWTLWALADSKTRQGARSEIRDDWLCCVRHDLVEPRVGIDGSTKVRTSANRP